MSAPTAQDVLMWALINRARLDPAGEAARDGIDLNEGLAPGTISSASKQPLAWNASLFTSADQHSAYMLTNNYFGHQGPGESDPETRETAAGFPSQSSWGENIVWQGSSAPLDATQTIISEEQALFMDTSVSGRGHRLNILNDNFQEVGVSQELGAFQGQPYASVVTQDFGTRLSGGQFLTGIAYNDTNGDGFYSVGEGRGNISVSVSGGSVVTAGPGEYSEAIGSGSQTTTFSGGDLGAPVTVTATITAGRNALLDLVGQSTVETSVSLAAGNGVSKIIGLGNTGLTLIGNNAGDTFVSPTGGSNILDGGTGFDTAVFSGTKASYTITNNANGTVTVAGLGVTDTLSSIEKLQFSDQSVSLGGHRPAHDDFNGDGTSDILFRNDATGSTWYAEMSNGTLGRWQSLGSSSTDYSVVGVGDFYGNGTSEELVRNGAGDTWFLGMSNGAAASWQEIGGSNPAYSVVGVADFYGNGTDDILFRNNSSGDSWFEAISNGSFDGWKQIGNSDTSYAAVGAGNFYGNGTDDILFRNNSTGDTWIEQISNGAFDGWHQVGGSDTHFSVVGVGDFYGNGTDDILFRNNSSGDTWIEAISNGAFKSWQQVGGSDTHYAVVAVGDYFGNGTDDILFRNNLTGDTWVEAISNGAFNGWHQVGGSNTSYTVKT
jgi:Cysteine-rich secretory protein family